MFAALLAANIILEWRLVNLSRYVRRFVERHRGIALFLSIFLSLAIGNLFGASGILCLATGLLSTFIMAFLYRAIRMWDATVIAIGIRRRNAMSHFRRRHRVEAAFVPA